MTSWYWSWRAGSTVLVRPPRDRTDRGAPGRQSPPQDRLFAGELSDLGRHPRADAVPQRARTNQRHVPARESIGLSDDGAADHTSRRVPRGVRRSAGGGGTADRFRRRFDHLDVGFEVFGVDAGATLICRTVGSPEPLAGGTFGAEHCSSFEKAMPTFAVGVGAFGESFADCRSRFGEMLSVAGATAYQPGDGTNVADYLIAAGNLGADIRVLYCLACEGRFSHLVRFETLQPGGMAGLSRLIAGCFEAVPCNALGVVMVAEAGGLVGAALRRSPTERIDGGGFFAHPGLRSRLTFTTERAFTRSVVLAAGVATRDSGGPAHARGQLRPIGPDHAGHFHAAAFRFRPVQRGSSISERPSQDCSSRSSCWAFSTCCTTTAR